MALLGDFIGEALQNSRLSLEDVNVQNNIRNLGKKTGFLDKLFTDPESQAINAQMQEASRNGQYRDVDIYYYQRLDGNDVITDESNLNCDRPDDSEKLKTTLQPSLFSAYSIGISESEVRNTLEQPNGFEQFRDRYLMEAMRVLREDMDRQLFTVAGNNVGANPEQGTAAGVYSALNLLNGNYEIDKQNFDQIVLDFQDGAYINSPISVVGSGLFRQFMNRVNIGAVNDGGIDFAQIADEYGQIFYRDNNTTTALGNKDYVLAIAPGFVKMYHYNFNQGQFEFRISDTDFKGTMPDPVYPFMYDYDISYDKGCDTGNGIQGGWTLRVWCWYDLFTLPDDAFSVYDELEGFNGIVGYDVTQS